MFWLFFVSFPALKAQNVQLHYDMGKGRGYLTSTVEMFRPDKYGNTFFFTDMDYNSVENLKGVTLAYWEIARALKFWKAPFAFHTEYNGGFGQWSEGNASGAYQINNAFLNGVEYSWNNETFSRGFTLQVLHKYIQGKHKYSFQLTGVWYLNMVKDKLSFTGYADFWREDNTFGQRTTRFCFQSEPQFWYNLNSNLSVGSEVEIASNFGEIRGFQCNPTLGVKYIF